MLRIMIIFLYGEDGFRSNRKLAEIKNKFTEKYKEGGTLFVFDFVEPGAKISDLIIKLSSGGLFSNKKLAIVKNILQNKTAAQDLELLDFLKKADKGEIKDLTLVFWEKERIDKKLKLAKFLLEKTKKQEFGLLDGSKLTNWIIGEICEEDINLLVKSKIDTDIFKTIDSLARQDKKTAAGLLHNHLSAGEDPFYLLSMYFYQFRNLLKVKELAEKNVSEREIAQKLKLHPFVARKSLEQGRNFSLDQLKKLYKDLCEIDFGAKTGKIEIELALDKFIATV